MNRNKNLYPSCIPCHLEKKDPKFKKYKEMIFLMQDKKIELNLLAKLVEIKMIYKDYIDVLKREKPYPDNEEE